MGLFNRIKDPVQGTARIVSTTRAPQGATHGTCHMNLVIEVPGMPAFAAEDSKICKVARWPQSGMVLPVTVDRNHLDRFEVDVKAVPDWRDQSRQEAQMMAQFANNPQAGAQQMPGMQVPGMPQMGGMVMGTPNIQVVGASSPEEAAAAIRQAEMALGMDLDGDGTIGGAGPAAAAPPMPPTPGAPPPPPPYAAPGAATGGGDDTLAQLERLAALRNSGALTEAEFAAQKARILGQG